MNRNQRTTPKLSIDTSKYKEQPNDQHPSIKPYIVNSTMKHCKQPSMNHKLKTKSA
jgi:hypothetical protein